ncbi:hypothetical protein BDN70DRAFT_11386 [Pholiota conissans]|uniref:Uncharacterized protein n=1 Tax=Pholiota conissans TaxID=109636 RepID=A0A9P5ZGW3_9AGAR|nr:hypothetical protein BDN70DRAFT_11386 [Pholiota conissans]
MRQAVVSLALLLSALSLPVLGVGTVPTCLSGFDWMFNHLGQSPCTVASALAQACTPSYDIPIPALGPLDNYLGPTPSSEDNCRCSSVFYSMISACALCQGAEITTWSFYDQNCSSVFLTVFAPAVPVGFAVPHYAYTDPTANGKDFFNTQIAQADNGPESTAPPQASSTSSTTTTGGVSIPIGTAPLTPKKKSNAGAIAGGVVGGLAGLAAIIMIVGGLIRRRRHHRRAIYEKQLSAQLDGTG